MKSFTVGISLVLACGLSQPNALFAKGSGGHGGGHGGGGHAGGGHASGGHASGGHASGGHASPASHGGAATRGASGTASTSSDGPLGARPRDGRPIVGTAVPRTGTLPPIVINPYRSFLPYRRWPSYSGGFGFSGLGLYPSPFWSGYAYGNPSYAYDYGSSYPGAYGYAPDPFDAEGPTGGLRLKVAPNDAEVYVDGYYAGIVDDFNGHFQRLRLTAGPHRVEVRALGYLPLAFDVIIAPRRTIEYRGALQR